MGSRCDFTDDTVMTLAIKKAIDEEKDLVSVMREVGQQYPICGYGNTFLNGFFARIQNHIIALVMVRL